MERIFGMHNMPQLPVGEFHWRNGAILAAASFFDITITGKGAHAASPSYGIDPIVAGSAVVVALQTIVSRSIDPKHPAVVTVGSFQAGVAPNVIPQDALLKGTARWIDPSVGETIERSMARIIQSTAEAYGATATFDSRLLAPATINEETAMTQSRSAATQVAGARAVVEMADPLMGAEDFSYMLGVKPGAYIMLGAQRPGVPNPGLHHPAYDFNDQILATGAKYWATLVEQQLSF
jgi:hippurate hydrolase